MLEKQRQQIDQIDQELVQLMEKRFNIVLEIAKIKKELNIAIENQNREQIVINQAIEQLHDKKYSAAISLFFEDVMNRSKELQEEFLNEE